VSLVTFDSACFNFVGDSLDSTQMGGIRAVPVDYFPNYHASLLLRAAPKEFSRSALIFRVIRANIAVDLNQKDKHLHFDDSEFSDGVARISELWSRIEAGIACMTNFGSLTHSVQDFYSHSNWIELHQHLTPIPLWDLTVASLPAAVQSGTYPSSSHGGAGRATHAELNKDCPFAWFSPSGARVVALGPNRGKTLFELGYDAALTATEVQFARLQRVFSRERRLATP
jgi:hypothetical protein